MKPLSGVKHMRISYNKLWKLLIDKGMKKKDFLSSASVAKLGKNEPVTKMDIPVLVKPSYDVTFRESCEALEKSNLVSPPPVFCRKMSAKLRMSA